jgi:hypothetical protein
MKYAAAALGVVLIGVPAEAAKHHLFVVIDAPYQMWNNSGTKIHLVAFGPRFRPAAGAEVLLGKRRVGRTDRHGTLIFTHRARKGREARQGVLTVRKRIRGVLHEGKTHFQSYRRTASFGKTRLYLYTDRAIYRPGETLRARVIAWSLKKDYRPAAGKKARFVLSGVTTKEVKLDSFGTAHVAFDLAGVRPIAHTLTVEVGEESHSRTVKVAHYRRPTLEMHHSFPDYLTPRSALEGTVRLADAEGRPPKKGTLVVSLLDEAGERLAQKRIKVNGAASYLARFSSRALRRKLTELLKGELTTLTLELKLGTSSVEHRLTLTDCPYAATIELDHEKYSAGGEVVALVKLTDLNEVAVPRKMVSLGLSVNGSGKTLRTLVHATDKRGVATFRFRAPGKDGDQLNLSARVHEVKRALDNASAEIGAKGALRSRLGVAQVRQGRWVPISVRLLPGFEPRERVLHCDITDYSGAIVSAFTLPIRRVGARWVARGRFKAPSWGTMLLTMFSIGARSSHLAKYRARRKPVSHYIMGMMLEGQQVTVHPHRELRLTLGGVPSRARPGQPVAYRLRVTTPDGRPAVAAVGAALVDRNVLGHGDPLRQVDPRAYYYNPALKVMATTGSKILTWPVVSRNWGCGRHDIALPPFPFRDGDGCGQWDDSAEDALGGLIGNQIGEAYGVGGLGLVGTGRGGGGGAPELTIRQKLDATAYWAPALRTAGTGRLAHRFKAPQTLSRHDLILVASDREGGVGLLRRTLTVARTLSVSFDLPPRMVAGDVASATAEIRNRTRRRLAATLSVRHRGLELLRAPAGARLALAPGQRITVPLRVRALRAGVARLELALVKPGGGLVDGERAEIQVVPRKRRRTTTKKVVRKGQPGRWRVTRPASAHGGVTLHVDYPPVVPRVERLQKMLAQPELGGDSLASVFSVAALVLRTRQTAQRRAAQAGPERARTGVRGESSARRSRRVRRNIERLTTVVSRGVRWLVQMQRPSGAFAYWRLDAADPYHTAYVLETLLDARRAGVRVPRRVVDRARAFLRRSRAPDGLWNVTHLAFWEGKRESVRTGLSAEILRAIAAAGGCDENLARLARKLVRSTHDPRTTAAALQCLLSCGRAAKVSRDELRRGAKRLLRLRKSHRHWEPSWFSAYGGNLEATAAAVTALSQVDRSQYARAIRDGVRFLIARQHSFGAWHNERGTAASVRALLAVNAGQTVERANADIEVRVNGLVTHQVRLGRDDPSRLAARLRHISLTRLLRAGANKVEVQYSGALRVPCRLVRQ